MYIFTYCSESTLCSWSKHADKTQTQMWQQQQQWWWKIFTKLKWIFNCILQQTKNWKIHVTATTSADSHMLSSSIYNFYYDHTEEKEGERERDDKIGNCKSFEFFCFVHAFRVHVHARVCVSMFYLVFRGSNESHLNYNEIALLI